MRRTIDRLGSEPLVGDGGMGSMLSAAVPQARCAEHANTLAPETVVRLHVDFIQAGADVIQTNTYGASPHKLARHGLEEEFERLVLAGVKLAREAREVAGRDVLVAGSIGPLGAASEHGEVGEPRLYARQAELLESRGVDLFVLETFSSLPELERALVAVREVTSLPIVCEVTVQDDAQLVTGTHTREVAERIAAVGRVLAVGVNCSLGPQSVLAALEEMGGALPLAAMANAGVPLVADGRLVYPNTTPAYFGEFASHAVALGAVLVGGCCGTTPVHVAAVREAVASGRRPAVAFSLVEPELPAGPQPEAEESQLAAKLRAGEKVISVELDPPKGGNMERLLASAAALAASGNVDFFDVNDSPLARARMNALVASALIERSVGVETIPHVTPRDATIRGLESQLLGAHAVGIRNILAVTGDPPPPGDQGGSDGIYQVDAIGLTEIVTAMNRGVDYSGKALDAPTSFFCGVAVNPAADDLAHELERFRRKVAAGARFAMTQVLFDAGFIERFLDALGGSSPVPLLIGVWPVRSHALALRLHNEVPGIVIPQDVLDRLERSGADAQREGVAVARDMLDVSLDLAAGAYLVPPFKEPEAVLELLG